MTQEKHTQGPWGAQASKIPDNTGGYDWCITDEKMAIIAEVFQNVGYAKNESDYPYNQSPVEANANLIAASPKMLRALKKLVHALSPIGGGYDDEDIIEAQEAIKSAEGQS